jgi:AraC-like DNA-binding protein
MPGFDRVVAFHVVTQGSFWVWLTDRPEQAIMAREGDVIVFPRGDEHVFGSERGLRDKANPSDFDRQKGGPLIFPLSINPDGEGGVCRFVCGYLGFDAMPFNPLLEALPAMFVARTSELNRHFLNSLVSTALDETIKDRAGCDVLLSRAAELMLVEVLRSHVANLPDGERNWFGALRDRHVGRAMHLIHGRPAETWTIDRLARAVGLSRSIFAERFADFVGMAPIAYLTRWRMQLAARRLQESGTSVAQAAADIGYESEAAFRRAFKRHVGMTPGAWQNRATPAH